MFDFSFGHLLVTVAGAAFLIGRKDLPHVCNAGGAAVGRVVGYLQRARQNVQDLSNNHELAALQKEFREGIDELNSIKSEILQAGSMRGTLTGQPHYATGIRSLDSRLATLSSQSTKVTPASGPRIRPPVPSRSDKSKITSVMSPHIETSGEPSGSVVMQSNMPAQATETSGQVVSRGNLATPSMSEELETASLAMVELALREKDKKEGRSAGASSSSQGGADIIADSIIDSLLLDELKREQSRKNPQDNG